MHEKATFAAGCFWGVEVQAAIAEASRDRAQARHSKPIATEIVEAGTFWPGEDYHQRYLEKRGLATCAV